VCTPYSALFDFQVADYVRRYANPADFLAMGVDSDESDLDRYFSFPELDVFSCRAFCSGLEYSKFKW
jgi:hypothetical protein